MWKHLEVELDYLVRRATFCGWQIAPRRISIMSWYMYFAVRRHLPGQPAVYSPNRILCAFVPAYCTVFPVARQPCMEFYGVHFTLPSDVDHSLPLPRLPKSNRPAGWSLCSNPCLRSTSKKHIFINGGKMFCSSRSYAKYSPLTAWENAPAELIRIKSAGTYPSEDPAVRLRWKSLLPAPA